MRSLSTLLVTAVLVTSCAPIPVFAQGSASQKITEHPYDYALDYCANRGGLGRYTSSNGVVKFSCVDDLSRVITIHT